MRLFSPRFPDRFGRLPHMGDFTDLQILAAEIALSAIAQVEIAIPGDRVVAYYVGH